ncbi:DNA repair protein RadC [candidate division KSB1 bacterium]
MSDKIKEPGFYRTRIKDWPESERPREKLSKHGAESLSDAELLAILLREGTGSITALDLAKSLLVQYKNIYELSGRRDGEFTRLKGIGKAKAITLVAAFELGRRVAAGSQPVKTKIHSPEAIAQRYIPVLETVKQEEFRVINLDSANNLLSDKVITRGSLNASIVHPREVFKQAITESAASIIVIHNHPSGNPLPSREDRKITEKLVNAGAIIGIEVIDHIIIAGREYYSFAEHNEITTDGNH